MTSNIPVIPVASLEHLLRVKFLFSTNYHCPGLRQGCRGPENQSSVIASITRHHRGAHDSYQITMIPDNNDTETLKTGAARHSYLFPRGKALEHFCILIQQYILTMQNMHT